MLQPVGAGIDKKIRPASPRGTPRIVDRTRALDARRNRIAKWGTKQLLDIKPRTQIVTIGDNNFKMTLEEVHDLLRNGGSSRMNNVGATRMDFSIYFFGSVTSAPADVYSMIRRVCSIADKGNFKAVWFPERHFDAFGGFSPNPALLAAAIATETRRLELRASIILPLHHSVRVAEEWAVVDNLSRGRFGGLALAPGWHMQDFAMAPDSWQNRNYQLHEKMALIEKFWAGKSVALAGADGQDVSVRTFPKPLSPIQFWFTSLGSTETIESAGRAGVGMLTNLLKQDISELKRKIECYRAARSTAGLNPQAGHVVVLLHTFLAEAATDAKAAARGPLKQYISSSMNLIQKSETTARPGSLLQELPEEDREYLLETSTERFLSHRALIGDVAAARVVAGRLVDAGVDEIACFVDFGVPHDELVNSVALISHLTETFTA